MKIIKIIAIATCCTAGILHADILFENDPNYILNTSSFTDENGLFSYTFSGGTNDSYRFLNPTIVMDISYINSVDTPEGWEATIQPNSITWNWTNTTDRLIDDVPVTFTVHSSETASTINTSGLILGEIYTDLSPDTIVGYQTFSYLQPIPEPSSAALIVISGVGLIVFKRKRGRTSQ